MVGSLWHEQENLLAAHAWCAHAAQGGERALRLTASLWRYFLATAQYALGYRLAEAALGLARGGVECADGALALVAMSLCAMRLGQYDVANSCAERSLAICRSLDDAASIARALSAVGSSLHAKGELLRAIASFQEACDLARAQNKPQSLGFALTGIAEVHRELGNLAEAEPFYEEALTLARAREDARATAIGLGNLASLWIMGGQLDRARAALRESMELRTATNSKAVVECQLDVVAALAAASASHAAAARFHGATVTRLRESGFCHDPADEAFITGWMARSREALGAAAFDAAEAEGEALNYEEAMAEMERWLSGSE